ncbi:MAG: efflux transporter periplasmic adaptor subunit [Kangiella sp.]|nr:MAG: efflux transporter periplasmic adaptor subunit [Kangiella sp.]
MNKNMNSIALGLVIGIAVTSVAYFLLPQTNQRSNAKEEMAVEKPLYWVAPMDSNYRRDKPGQSPMGMDLVAVYANGGSGLSSGSNAGAGTIKISPEVVNNLGVRTVMVKLASLHSQIKTVGYVKYDEDQLVHIHPRVEGWIEKLYVKAAGNPVIKNQPLYEIYSPALVNAQEELILALERKNNRLIKAAEERLRALQLPSRAIQSVKKTRKIKQTITFYAPQSGVIDNLNIREGFFVKPGTTIMSIGKLDQVWVEAEIFERQSSQVEKGLAVSMSLDYLPGVDWQGKVDYVYPTLDPKTRTVKVRLRFDNKNKQLKPNMFAQVIIHPKKKPPSLLIPKEALIRTGSLDRVVLALGEGRFKSIEVKVGRFDESSVEILAGLDEGEMVVSSAHFLLDSESSKSSDFKRMHHPLDANAESTMFMDETINSAEAEGVINNVMIGHRMLNISRGPVKAWGREAATLDYIVSEDLNMKGLENGMSIQFTFHLSNDEFVITEIYPQASAHNSTSSQQ